MSSNSSAIVIMAAGQGSRMKSNVPKVLHEICGVPLISHIIDRIAETTPTSPIAFVVEHEKQLVIDSIQKHAKFKELDISFIHQGETRGTGDAVRSAIESDWGARILSEKRPVVVLPGDLPLISNKLIQSMIEPMQRATKIRLLTCELSEPAGYGRIVRRGKKGVVIRIVEEKDATPRQKSIKEVAVSIYQFDPAFLKAGIRNLSKNNAQNEYYLTDLIARATQTKNKIAVVEWTEVLDLRGVNTPWELTQARSIMNRRILKSHAENGVCLADNNSIWIDSTVKIGDRVQICPNTIIRGSSTIGPDTQLGAGVYIKDSTIGANCIIKPYSIIDQSIIGNSVKLGPSAHLRPESKVGDGSKVGNFVELKKTSIGKKTSIAHLSYLGDATVGNNCNIGCGFITCNFDGREINGKRKHETIIEDDCFLGSDCQVVAPILISKGAYIASGSTITKDVESDSLAIARSKQINKLGYASRLRRTLNMNQTTPKDNR